MLEDKCPTCPKYGTGDYCDCGRYKCKLSNEPIGCYLVMIVAMICLTLIFIFG